MNLLDTPGHRDFSEDTYRVLSAVDAVVMVLDAAKGIESADAQAVPGLPQPQPAGDDVPQQVRPPGRDPLELLDEIEQQINAAPHTRSRGRWAAATSSAGSSTVGPSATSASPARLAVPRRRWRSSRHAGPTRPPPRAVPAVGDRDRRDRPARRRRRRHRPAIVPGRAVHAAVRRVGAHQLRCAHCCSTPWSRWRPRRRHACRHRRPARVPSNRRSARSSSRCRPTWIRRTATASPSPASARAASSAA
jgi:hypothetical protein